jgi:hypothetical protein
MKDIQSAWHRGGLRHILARSPKYIQRQISSLIYIPINYNTITRDELISHCEKNNKIWYYDSGTELEIKPPLNQEAPPEFEELIGTIDIEPNFVCEVSNVKLVGPFAIPQLPNGDIILETFANSIATFEDRLDDTFDTIGTVRTIKSLVGNSDDEQHIIQYDTAAHLVTRAGHSYDQPNYAHWVAEILPQLRGIEHYRNVTNKQPKLLINPNSPPWLTELLELMGYSSDDWIEWNHPTATVKNLIIPKLNYMHCRDVDPNPLGKKWARDKLVKKFPENNCFSDAEERVFLSRESAERRNIINIDEVKELLNRYNFDIYRLENLSMSEEIELISQAKILVGACGANLGAVIFSSDAQVIEVFPHNARSKYYYTFCNELDLDYMCITGKPHSSNTEEAHINDDIFVDIEKLEESIQETIE